MPDTIGSRRRKTINALKDAAGDDAALEARLLMCGALGCDELELFFKEKEIIDTDAEEKLDALVERRIGGEPIQYILGEWEFMGLAFTVREGVLIPRQDTETLAEEAIRRIKRLGGGRVLDMCCGTGCIGISIAKYAGAEATLCDISDECLKLAAENAEKNGVSARIIKSDLFDGVDEKFDMIVCNPPYIRSGDISALQREVRREPLLALDGGVDGLNFYRRIKKDFKKRLTRGGTLMLEIGFDQAADIRAIFGHAEIIKDICGNDRVAAIDTKEDSDA